MPLSTDWTNAMDRVGKFMLERPRWVTALIILALVALPVAVWLDLRNLSDQSLRLQATSLDSIISEIRAYYSRNVVARVQQSPGQTKPSTTITTFPVQSRSRRPCRSSSATSSARPAAISPTGSFPTFRSPTGRNTHSTASRPAP